MVSKASPQTVEEIIERIKSHDFDEKKFLAWWRKCKDDVLLSKLFIRLKYWEWEAVYQDSHDTSYRVKTIKHKPHKVLERIHARVSYHGQDMSPTFEGWRVE